MSRLTDLLSKLKQKNSALGAELEKEIHILQSRRPFGLNFERHLPENVELIGRPVRRMDKVRILPARGTTDKGDSRLWRVSKITNNDGTNFADLRSAGDGGEIHENISVDDLVVVAETKDCIYPGLISTGRVERGGGKPFHTVINAENLHALKTLLFTHRGKVDCIYIDPPYNSGDKDWKYNNDYVESDDLYRHSKWLAFMERRLKLAKKILNPISSTLIVTIDEREYLRLGLLLEQVFPEAKMRMISSVINPKGVGESSFRRVDEYIFVLQIGEQEVKPLPGLLLFSNSVDIEAKKIVSKRKKQVGWQTFRRGDLQSARGTAKGGPRQFYPIYVNQKTHKIEEVGEPLKHARWHASTEDRKNAPSRKGCVTVFPVRDDGTEINWSVTRETLRELLKKGYARATKATPEKPQKYIIQYLKRGTRERIESGEFESDGYNDDGSIIAYLPEAVEKVPATQWHLKSHNPDFYGKRIVEKLLPGRTFPFPKSVYAVEDIIRLFVRDKKDAVVLDFFCGSGTTAHAIMRLNRQDGGGRQSIIVTNNEISPDEEVKMLQDGLRRGDQDWEKLGIVEHITKPRIEAAVTGQTPDGNPVVGEYKFTDKFPMAEGFKENVEFLTLTYESPISIRHNRSFGRIAPLLWIRAGSQGRRIDDIPEVGWDVADTYGILEDLDKAAPFCSAVNARDGIRIAYIITDDERRFQAVARRLQSGVEPIRLYESYMNNFRFSIGDST